MPDSYKELIKSNPDETEIRSFLVNGDQVSVTLRIPDTLRDAAKEEAALRGIGHDMYLIRVVPESIDFLNSDFKKQGFDSRQHLDF